MNGSAHSGGAEGHKFPVQEPLSKSARKRAARKARASAVTTSASPTRCSNERDAVPKEIIASTSPPFGSLARSQLWLHVLTFEDHDCTPLAFITAHPITSAPSLSLYLPRKVLFHLSIPEPLDFRLDQPDADPQGKAAALKRFNTALFNLLCDRHFSCPRQHGSPSSADLENHITDDPLGFLLAPLKDEFSRSSTLTDDIIDWDQVRNPWSSITQQSLETIELDDLLPAPFARRLCKESRLFRFIRCRPDIDLDDEVSTTVPMLATKSYKGHVSYRKWFEGPDFGVNLATLPADDVLVEVHVVKSPPRYTSQHEWRPMTGSASDERMIGVVPASVLRQSRFTKSQWNSFFCMPSFIRLLSDHVIASRARQHLKLPSDFPLDLLAEALTPTRANVGYDYERLEILGDAVLKMATTVHLYQSDPVSAEGQYSRLRQGWTDNLNLQRCAQRNGLAPFLLVESWNPPFWVPAPAYGTEVQRKIFKDELSDCVEALLGAAWLYEPATAIQLGATLQLPFGGIRLWCDRKSLEEQHGPSKGFLSHIDGLEKAEMALGYQFNNRSILLQALTHSSFGEHHYERLEFLGDSVVDCWAVNRLYHLHPSMPPGQITLLKGVVVCNTSMAFQVAKKLHLVGAIRQWGLEGRFRYSLAELDIFDEADYQNSVWRVAPDKVIADVFESLVAAIFVDSGYRLEEVFNFLERQFGALAASLPRDFLGDPVSQLMRWSQSHKCVEVRTMYAPLTGGAIVRTYVIGLNSYSRGDGHEMLACEVFFHSEHIGSAVSPSIDVATQLASSQALAYLTNLGPEDLKAICVCSFAPHKSSCKRKNEEVT